MLKFFGANGGGMTELIVSIKNSILYLTLNRPEKANALRPELAFEIKKQIENADKDPSVRAIYLSGNGSHFCTGADLDWVRGAEDDTKGFGHFAEMYAAFLSSDLPIVGRVHGRIMGAGFGLTAAMDLVICERQSRFSLPEAKWGLIPGVITPLIVRKIGVSKFKYLALTGRDLSADEALQGGLVHETFTSTGNDDPAEDLLHALRTQNFEALRAIKQSLRAIDPLNAYQLDRMAELSNQMRRRPETKTTIQRFYQRKKP